jgi:hypothetical protein
MSEIIKRTAKVFLSLGIASSFIIQSYSQFSYIPPRPDHITAEDYRGGIYVLKDSYRQIKSAKNGIVAIDYWNIAVAYTMLGQSKDSIYYFLVRSKEINELDFCSLATITNKSKGGVENTRFYKALGQSYKELLTHCEEIERGKKKDTATIIKPGTNKELIYKLKRISELDQKARFDLATQKPMDAELIKEVEAIIQQYGYPGRNLVGEEYESIAWLVIQHAELSYQEKYLPLIHQAVKDKQLDDVPLKMLIDRIYAKKTQTQIFGSQGGVDFADDKVIEQVKRKYSLY